ncbi:class I adenylate-forming enzyme family protein [Hoeflea poritis]|uniref:Class I adenylate-forming enzyme family protein n=1 Tax=Hoeflea poritis TaxID=2993659 RepID=A0ABT4VK55_9HYPH|nr:class I adenylate-forming enzyme family protein [Hoeflea poritis]MDA4845101.1 class I adenylate-forming enzyme family protein [Hoeflea poritis]
MTGPSARVVAAGRKTSAQTLADAAHKWPDATALLIDGTRLSWRSLLDDARLWARGLIAAGVKSGDHVGILMPNCVDYARLFYACGFIGATALTVNARFRDDELAYAIRHSDMDVLFIGGHALPHLDFHAMLTRIYPDLGDWRAGRLHLTDAPRLRAIYALAYPHETGWHTEAAFLEAADTIDPALVERLGDEASPDAPALMMYSSGTTSRPKACLISHRSLGMIGAAFAERFDLSCGDRVMNPLPFFHMSAMLPMSASRASGAALFSTAHFEPGEVLRLMDEERVTFGYLSFPTLVNQLIGHTDFAGRDCSALRFLHCVGPAKTMEKYTRAFPSAQYINAYGLTEATGVPCFTDPADPPEEALNVSGRPFAGVAAKAVDPETLCDLAPGERGEIWLSGWPVFEGYFKDAEATDRALVDGWLRTGDMGHVRADGCIVYEGRLKDMLKIGGENVAALEIETWLCSHPYVRIAQVIGVPDDHLVEVAAAYVQLAENARMTPRELVDHCVGRIARYKIPRYVRFVDSWPMSTTKIQKFKLPRDFSQSEKIEPGKPADQA